jgi:hypothetical protein
LKSVTPIACRSRQFAAGCYPTIQRHVVRGELHLRGCPIGFDPAVGDGQARVGQPIFDRRVVDRGEGGEASLRSAAVGAA